MLRKKRKKNKTVHSHFCKIILISYREKNKDITWQVKVRTIDRVSELKACTLISKWLLMNWLFIWYSGLYHIIFRAISYHIHIIWYSGLYLIIFISYDIQGYILSYSYHIIFRAISYHIHIIWYLGLYHIKFRAISYSYHIIFRTISYHIQGYISHQHQKLVVSKQNPFPSVSAI